MADESTAYGRWEKVGEEPYELDRSLPAVRYRWQAPGRFGHFTIDFQSTESRPERRFYPVEVLSSLLRREPADDFVERVCRFGVGLLPELEEACRDCVGDLDPTLYVGKEFPCRETLEFLLAMFMSRRTGHARVTRRFNRWDDFVDTTHSAYRPESLVPGIDLPKRTEGSSGMGVINLIQEMFSRAHQKPTPRPGRECRLDASPLRTPLDQILIHGVFRDGDPGTLSFAKVIESVAPALIDGIQVENDSNYLADHAKDFRHFVTRLTERYFYDTLRFGHWLRQESEKGFVRLLPGFKQFDRVAREAAREKGRRFYRRVLWTAFEAMSRSYGAVALWTWVSFTRSTVVAPSPEEESAFRWYNAPLVCTGGLPLWFLGPNLLRWVFGPFIEFAWSRRPDQEFDLLTRLIGLYAHLAAERRLIDATKKRRVNTAGQAKRHTSNRAEQYEETPDGKIVKISVPTVRPSLPKEAPVSSVLEFTESRVCPCGGRLALVIDEATGNEITPTVTDREIFALVECVECNRELTFRTLRPEVG